MNHWYLSSDAMTVSVCTSGPEDIIIIAPSIVRGFKGNRLAVLIAWMRQQPGFKYEQIYPK